MIYKICKKCNKTLPSTIEYFYKIKTSSDGLYSYCKECAKSKATQWTKNNPEKRKAIEHKANTTSKRKNYKRLYSQQDCQKKYFKQYQKENMDKFLNYAKNKLHNKTHKITKDEWKKCKEYFGNCCAYCGLPIECHYIKFKDDIKLGDFHKEHVDSNGLNDLSNCVPSCKICNSKKHNMTLEKWYEENEFFTEERLDRIMQWLNYVNEIYNYTR